MLEPTTASGARIERLMHGQSFDAINLVSRAPDSASGWPASLARASARQLYESVIASREVLLLGRRVARSFAGLSPHLDALHAAPYFSSVCPTVPNGRGGWDICRVWIAPHPSGRSRWWNNVDNRHRATAFFSRILGQMEAPLRPRLPEVTPPETWEGVAETRCWPRF